MNRDFRFERHYRQVVEMTAGDREFIDQGDAQAMLRQISCHREVVYQQVTFRFFAQSPVIATIQAPPNIAIILVDKNRHGDTATQTPAPGIVN